MPKRLCACGCGEEIPIAKYPSWQKEYVNVGHHRRGKHYWDTKATVVCACGCGEEVPKYDYRGRERIFKYGHNANGVKRPPETIEKMRQSQLNREWVMTSGFMAARAKQKGKPIPQFHNPEARAKAKAAFGRSRAEKMDGCYHTDIEQILENVLKEHGIKYFFEHQISCYSVDFFLPEYNLVVEADGIYWHRTDKQKQKDARKNVYLENSGHDIVRLPGDLIRNGFAWDHLERELYWQEIGV